MGLLEFNKLPINTLVGADWKTFKVIAAGSDTDAAYKGKYGLTKAVCRVLSPLAALPDKRYEKLLANQPLEHDPEFILVDWRLTLIQHGRCRRIRGGEVLMSCWHVENRTGSEQAL